MNKAFIFPGQGTQIVGMGKDFYDKFASARETFSIVDNILGYKLSNIIFFSSSEELKRTIHAQPAIMTLSVAIIKVMEDLLQKKFNNFCQYVAGHSLGEYSALCAINSFTIKETTELLKIRASSMEEAARDNHGIMVACLGISIDKIEEIISRSQIDKEVCQIANDNIVNQSVISGNIKSVEIVSSQVKEMGGRVIPLNVSGPFHSSLMDSASLRMKVALESIIVKEPSVPILPNILAIETIDTEQIKKSLINQITGRVRWRETLDRLVKLEVTELVEIGCGNVLTNMSKKAKYPFITHNIGNVEELETYINKNF